MTHRKIQYWVIPPEADAEFVANMEEVLDTYAKLYDPSCPVLCMDEQPVQLVREARPPIAATAKHPRRVDYEYERRYGEHLYVHGAAGGIAPGHGPRGKNQSRLGLGDGTLPGGPLPPVRQGDSRLRQPQHAHERRVL